MKQECITAQKAEAKRWRLIMAFPVVDQLIDHLLYTPSLDAEIAVFDRIPSKPGFSFVHGGAQAIYGAAPFPEDEHWLELDKKGWDWSVHGWYHSLDAEWRIRRSAQGKRREAVVGRFGMDAFQLLRVRAKQHADLPIACSDGLVLARTQAAIEPSGMKNTLSFNSFMQAVLKIVFVSLCGKRFDPTDHYIMAQGDDTLERMKGLDVAQYQEFIRFCGHTPQEAARGRLVDLAFCSHRILPIKADRFGYAHYHVFIPDTQGEGEGVWAKHNWRLAHQDRGADSYVDKLFGYCIEYAFHPRFPLLYSEYEKAVIALGDPRVKVRSMDYFQELHFPMPSKRY